ncbi:MAG: dihydroorotate dehydrogenase electron transfer subunit [Syntrophobacteraceae bacterium]
MEKTQEKARIICREQVADQIFHLRLESPLISGRARAGQFVMLKVRDGTDPLLRRPFSFYRIHPGEGEIEVLYRVTGRGTLVLSRLAPGDHVSLIGPLGNGFELPLDKSLPLAFIAGGIGIAPLRELIAQVLSGRDASQVVNLFYGARTASEILPGQIVREFGVPVHFATDDGSLGYKGRVTRLFEDFTTPGGEGFHPVEVYSCGPLAMQYHVAKWALANDVLAQLSLESLMACGIGACLGCALPASGPESAQSPRFVHVCEDGPIFSAGSIQWNQILVQQAPRPTYLFS